MKKIVLIDAHAVIHRAYHALPPLTTPSGESINAVYGFTSILLKMLSDLKPDYVVAAFDLSAPTFRHIVYERYKTHRPETPDDLASQFGKVKEVLKAFQIPVIEKEGYEADDVIGTIVKKLEKKSGLEIVIVTGDLDTLQLVRAGVKVYSMKKGISDTVVYDERAVQDRFGLSPSQLIDFKGLKGDPSDNIPGVKGIGEKTAASLIQNFGSLERVYKAFKKGAPEISKAVAERLKEGEKDAKLSKELATIHTSAPINFEWAGLNPFSLNNNGRIRGVFEKFGFTSLLKRLADNQDSSLANQAALSVSTDSGPPIEEVDSLIKWKDFVKKQGASTLGLTLYGPDLFLVSDQARSLFKINPRLLLAGEGKKFFNKNRFYVYDGKSALYLLQEHGITKCEFIFDLLLAAYLTEPFRRDFSLTSIIYHELRKLVLPQPQRELFYFFEVARALEKKLRQGNMGRVFYEIEMPLISILAAMEERGVLVDVAFLKKLSQKLDAKLFLLTKTIYEGAGEQFNINSSQQLSRILFAKLNIATQGLRKTEKGGVISTRESELEKLKSAHPIVAVILEYRELMKLKTTYVDVLPKLVNSRTGRIHTTFHQEGTATGRLSSSDPNLQNIPILSESGREIRKAFISSPGFLFVSFDYSQIELRVAAHLAQDKKMIKAFQDRLDIHKLTAAEIYNVPLESVTPELRRAAKTLNFGVLYGMGAQAFAESTGMPRAEAKKFIEEYFKDFVGIRKYIEDTKKFAEEHGYVETLFGRRRYIPEIYSSNWQLKREAERMAVNMPIQGTATGDIIKMAMIKIDGWIKKEKLEDRVRMILQVHDELVFEIKKDITKRVLPKIKNIMEGVIKLKVPLEAEAKAGPNWGEQEVF